MLNVAFQCPFPFLFFLQKTSSLVFKKPRLDTGNEQSKGRSKRLFGVLMGTLQERASESKTVVVRFLILRSPELKRIGHNLLFLCLSWAHRI